jgi:hypothetical protein
MIMIAGPNKMTVVIIDTKSISITALWHVCREEDFCDAAKSSFRGFQLARLIHEYVVKFNDYSRIRLLNACCRKAQGVKEIAFLSRSMFRMISFVAIDGRVVVEILA